MFVVQCGKYTIRRTPFNPPVGDGAQDPFDEIFAVASLQVLDKGIPVYHGDIDYYSDTEKWTLFHIDGATKWRALPSKVRKKANKMCREILKSLGKI